MHIKWNSGCRNFTRIHFPTDCATKPWELERKWGTIHFWRAHEGAGGSRNSSCVCGVYCFSTIDLLFIFADGVINCLLFVDVINIWLLTLSFIYSFKICIQFNECLYFYLVYLKSLLHYAKGRYSEMPRSIWRFRI